MFKNIGLSSIKLFLINYKILIFMIITGGLMVIIFVLFYYIQHKNYFLKIGQYIARYLFFPAPKSTGFLARCFLKFLTDDHTVFINNFFYKFQKHYKLIIVFDEEPWNTMKNFIINSNSNLTTVIYNNYGLIFIHNQTNLLLNNIFIQLSSYTYPIEKLFIHYNSINNYKDFQIQLQEIFLEHFTQLMDINIIYDNDNYESYLDNQGINYDYFQSNTYNNLKRSLNNGFLIHKYEENYQWINEINIGVNSLSTVMNMNNNKFLDKETEFLGNYKNKLYLKFWNKFYVILFSITLLWGGFKIINDYQEYEKFKKTINYGNDILFNKNNNNQFNNAQKFLSLVGKLSLKKVLGNFYKNNDIKNLDLFFLKVYSSSIFDVYQRKIQEQINNIQYNYDQLLLNIDDYNYNTIEDLPIIFSWNEMMKSIDQINEVIKELNNIFDENNPNNIYKTQDRIHNITGMKHHVELINLNKYLIEVRRSINHTLLNSLDIIFGQLNNSWIVEKKNCLYKILIQLTNLYTDNNKNYSLDFLNQTLDEVEFFITQINKNIYGSLDYNQWQWPKFLYDKIDTLMENQWIDPLDYHHKNIKYNQDFIKFKQELFSWNGTFLSPINKINSRDNLINGGDTNLKKISIILKNILNNELIQIIQSQNIPLTSLIIPENKILLWNIDKLKIISSLSELYKNIINQWNHFENNGFLMAIGKIINYNFSLLLLWFIKDSLIIEKYNNKNIDLQKNNWSESIKILNIIHKNIPQLIQFVPSIKIIISHQITNIAQSFLAEINGCWFNNITKKLWDGKKDLLTLIMNTKDINVINNIFIKDFIGLDGLLNQWIVPFINEVLDQNFMEENQWPYEITQLSQISSQLILYKQSKDNDLKKLEQQILNYNNKTIYDLFKLPLKQGFSNGNLFLITADQLHNNLVLTAKNIVEKEQLKLYNQLVKYFNTHCFGKIPLIVNSQLILDINHLIQLKSLFNQCTEILFILESKGQLYQEQIQWLKSMKTFFDSIEIINNTVRINFNIELQHKNNDEINNHLIMRWHTHFAEKETHNVNKINGSITNNNLWQIVVDIVRDGSISVLEYETIVPLNSGCVVFSDTQWGLWKFINEFFFQEVKDGYILQIKIPIIINNGTIRQEWIVTYIKINKIPQILTKGVPID